MKSMYDSVISAGDEMFASSSQHDDDSRLQSESFVKAELLKVPAYDFARIGTSCVYARKIARNYRKRIAKATREQCESFSSLKTTLSGENAYTRKKYIEQINEESERCILHLHSNGILVPASYIRHVLIPPCDHPRGHCQTFLSSNLSMFPYDHPINVEYRALQRRQIKDLGYWRSRSRMDTSNQDKPGRFLPRVALLGMEELAKKGRRKRNLIEHARPTPCWPQHLLDKLRLCMDNCHLGKDDKSALFELVTGR